MVAARLATVAFSERLGDISDHERRIEREAPATLKRVRLFTHEEIVANATDADVIILGAVEPFDAAALEALPRCRAVVRRGVGFDNVDVAAATRLGIVVANVPDANTEEVSDHALALVLALERRVPFLDAAVRAGRWTPDQRELAGIRQGIRRLSSLTVGIVGFGRIGQSFARKARSVFGSLLAFDTVDRFEAARAAGVEIVGFDDLLARSDAITLHAPLTAATRHLIGHEALARMRAGATLVNTARGELVDEQALIDALRDGHLRGAALDVVVREPLPADDPLLTTGRVIVTGHSASAGDAAQHDLRRLSAEAAIRVLNGELPASIVDEAVLASHVLRVRSGRAVHA